MKVIRKLIYPLTIILCIFIIIGVIVVKNNLNNNKYDEIEIVNQEENDIVKDKSNEEKNLINFIESMVLIMIILLLTI